MDNDWKIIFVRSDSQSILIIGIGTYLIIKYNTYLILLVILGKTESIWLNYIEINVRTYSLYRA